VTINKRDIMKKFTALLLIFSLMMLSVNLYAKKRGAKLIITKLDGQLIKGELITVKPNSLLLLDAEGKDVSVGIADIKVITIVKKSKATLGAGIGFLVCGGVGALIAPNLQPWSNGRELGWTLLIGAIGGAGGLLIGGITGALLGTDKTIHFEGMTDLEIQKTLDKLSKKARIRDYK